MMFDRVLFTVLYRNARRLFRRCFLSPRPPVHWSGGTGLDRMTAYYEELCRRVLTVIPRAEVVDRKVCEIGPGSSLALADMMCGLGARHVDLYEPRENLLTALDVRILERLRDAGLPNQCQVVTPAPGSPLLNASLVTVRRAYWEGGTDSDRYGMIYSVQVLEHVEDLNAFMKRCFEALEPGGTCVHLVDLGGHDAFEDPMPPLDFQRYPDWLWRCMYPPYERVTRRFLPEYETAVIAAGFKKPDVVILRRVDDGYLKAVRPLLRTAAASISDEALSIVEFLLVCRKP